MVHQQLPYSYITNVATVISYMHNDQGHTAHMCSMLFTGNTKLLILVPCISKTIAIATYPIVTKFRHILCPIATYSQLAIQPQPASYSKFGLVVQLQVQLASYSQLHSQKLSNFCHIFLLHTTLKEHEAYKSDLPIKQSPSNLLHQKGTIGLIATYRQLAVSLKFGDAKVESD